MLIIGIIIGVFGVRLFDRYKNRKNRLIHDAYQRGLNEAKLGKFDEMKKA